MRRSGWSKNCSAPTRSATYRSTDGQFHWLDPLVMLPPDVATTTTMDGQTVPYVVRLGAARSTVSSTPSPCWRPSPRLTRSGPTTRCGTAGLVFNLQGGVAIGRTQGTVSGGAMLRDDVLKPATVVSSTGLRTTALQPPAGRGANRAHAEGALRRGHGVPYYTVGVAAPAGSSSTCTPRTTPACSTPPSRSTRTGTWSRRRSTSATASC